MAATATAPKTTATATGPERKFHAEIPAARATISSDERASRQKASMPPSRMAKGRICIATNGIRSPAMPATTAKPASGRVAARRSSSVKSNSETSSVSANSMSSVADRNRRAT